MCCHTTLQLDNKPLPEPMLTNGNEFLWHSAESDFTQNDQDINSWYKIKIFNLDNSHIAKEPVTNGHSSYALEKVLHDILYISMIISTVFG